MATKPKRKKQPEQVRRNLLDCAARLAVAQGLSRLTLQAVANAAGVSKGGLLYHFGHKHALIEAVFTDLLEQLDTQIERLIAADPEPCGRFTRAYIKTVFAQAELEDSAGHAWLALSVTLVTDPDLRRLWMNWLNDRLARHREDDQGTALNIARFAADGIWLASILKTKGARAGRLTMIAPHLIAMTRNGGRAALNSLQESRHP